MNNKFEKTIFALSSAWGMAGVSVIRISGDESKKVLRKRVPCLQLRVASRHWPLVQKWSPWFCRKYPHR